MKKLAVKFEGKEIMSIDDYDIFACYRDLWKTKSEKRNAIWQGISSSDGCMENCIKLRINAGNKQDKAIADAYGNKFIIPLDFEMLDSAAPYYQAGLGNRLCYKFTFNDYKRVTKCAVSSPKVPDAKYKITDISLEYEIVTQLDLARSIRSEYQHMALLYDRILRHRQLAVNKSDTMWNWSFNMPCKSLKGILVLFEEEKSCTQDTSKFYHPGIQKVSVTIEGKPNQLYSQGMRSFEQYDEACKYFAEGRLANDAQAQLQLYDVSLGEYLVNKYVLWLDFRMIDENELDGMGRRIENASEGITLQVEKKAETAGALNAYILECYMDWFPSLICKNYIFKHFVKTVEPTFLKFCTIMELITLHLEYTIAQVKYANFSYVHAQTFVLLKGEMATVSTGFRKLKFWLWLLRTVFYLNQTGF